jgi:hypothetical protein
MKLYLKLFENISKQNAEVLEMHKLNYLNLWILHEVRLNYPSFLNLSSFEYWIIVTNLDAHIFLIITSKFPCYTSTASKTSTTPYVLQYSLIYVIIIFQYFRSQSTASP